ncbi:DUF1566 domain-containing protein [Sulfurimonas sp.]|uniref:Lcl C-terminal domain-containing protein n=1 Tax=Sulfurimonas sp. TaxID=2022749 RepID=UPI00356AF8A1
MSKYISITFIFFTLLFLGCSDTKETETVKKVSQNLDVFTDKTTGYTWIDNNQTKQLKKDWLDAVSYCEELYANGHEDWHLPTKEQLKTIVDKSKTPAIKSGFKNVTPYGYWTNDKIDIKDGYVWALYFNHGGEVWELRTDTNYVRCVRSTND